MIGGGTNPPLSAVASGLALLLVLEWGERCFEGFRLAPGLAVLAVLEAADFVGILTTKRRRAAWLVQGSRGIGWRCLQVWAQTATKQLTSCAFAQDRTIC